MSFYSDFAPRRVRQIAADAVAVVLLVLSIAAGAVVHSLINALASVGDGLHQAGTGFELTMIDLGDRLGAVPLIGDGIRGPFDAASGAGGTLAEAGTNVRSFIELTAVLAGVGVAMLPIAVLLLVWLWVRLRFARRNAEARAILRLADGQELLALRALQSSTAAELSAVSPHVARDWRDGDAATVRGLAALAARDAGVRVI
ncbi:hypothetical protein [Salinibacterium sp. ZJ77]|uniref:hypothetical protein n=1 Tax=Salinibacterium sp. ZJ77 TaxID=2708337 RepID=UPI001422BBCF|nr:hypothetical protein [Salinibacterium sp. ZJ77]